MAAASFICPQKCKTLSGTPGEYMPNFRHRRNPCFSPSASNTHLWAYRQAHTCLHLPPPQRGISARQCGGAGRGAWVMLKSGIWRRHSHQQAHTRQLRRGCMCKCAHSLPLQENQESIGNPSEIRDLFLSLSPLLMHSRHRRSNLVPSLSCTAYCVSNNSFRKLGSALQ